MLDSQSQAGAANPLVFTTTDRGHSPEEMAEMALNKIMSVSEDAPPVIREQAYAHRQRLKEVLIFLHETHVSKRKDDHLGSDEKAGS